jgi:hypothetical protein
MGIRLATRAAPGRALFAAMALTVLLGVLGTSQASAAPKGEFAAFADCPLSNPELSGCIASRVESGEITIGKQTVPIKDTQTLQGGFIETAETKVNGQFQFVGAADGNTLSKTPQTVPGGLLGTLCKALPGFLRVLCNEFFGKGLTEVKATTELAAPASAIGLNEFLLAAEKGTALSLPVKIKLDNAFLGNNCYIGSNANPITLKLTTGTTSPPAPNKPINGKFGTTNVRAEGEILVITNNSLVDNSFAAPGATGCGGIFSFLVDPALDTVLGIPATAGNNTAILNGTLEQTGAEPAREHE